MMGKEDGCLSLSKKQSLVRVDIRSTSGLYKVGPQADRYKWSHGAPLQVAENKWVVGVVITLLVGEF